GYVVYWLAAAAGQFPQRHDVAQAEIEALSADWREGVGGLSDQHEAPLAEPICRHAGQRKALRAVFNGDLAEHGLHALFDGPAEFGDRQLAQPGRLLRRQDPDEAGTAAGQGNLREGAAFRVKFARGI